MLVQMQCPRCFSSGGARLLAAEFEGAQEQDSAWQAEGVKHAELGIGDVVLRHRPMVPASRAA